MEQKENDAWRDNLHILTREEQHRYYGGEISPEDFDMQGNNLADYALKTDAEMCSSNPDKQARWNFLMSEIILQKCYKNQEGE